MTIKLFEKIQRVIDNICERGKLDLDDLTKNVLYYNCYFVSYEIRNGFFPEVFNQIDMKILNELKKIDNVDFVRCACYDSSRTKDTIYIYNKNKYESIKHSIEYLNTRGLGLEKDSDILPRDRHIANLLSYDQIKRDYREAFDETKMLNVSYEIIDFRDIKNKKQFNIISYQTYKNKLVSNYERLHRINNLPLFNRYKGYRCLLIIDDIGI